MTALLRYQAALLLRSNRWIFPLVAYGALIAVGAAGSTPLAEGLDWSAAMLLPVSAFLTRSMLTAEPDASWAGVSPANAALRHGGDVASAARWPGDLPPTGAAALLAVTWTASVLAAARRERSLP